MLKTIRHDILFDWSTDMYLHSNFEETEMLKA